jgi:alkanesulfonate monooxygenase SsuD/methylene tetrahydromethanopterin reductase-like flavin-dependent oxidoreductase (luciferase family)
VSNETAGSTRPTFGCVTMPRGTWAELVADWQQLEAWGLDSAYLPDRPTNPWNAEGPWIEAWTGLAGLAASTQRIQLGVAVTAIGGRNPALLALEALTVDRIAGGRVIVGLGAGGGPAEHALLGGGPVVLAERFGRFEEFVNIVSGHVGGGKVEEKGQWYRSSGQLMGERPVSGSPSLLVAANGPKSLRIAAKYGAGWNSYGDPGGSTVDLVRKANARLDELCTELGRDPRSLRRSLLLGVAADTDWASGAEFAEVVRRNWEAGVNDFLFYVPPSTSVVRRGSSPEEAAAVDGLTEEIATEVVPKLREELG